MLREKTIENDLEYLRQISRPVDFAKDDVGGIIKELKEFCTTHYLSMALAAVQLGIPLRILYLRKTRDDKLDDEDYNENRVLINPEILEATGETTYWEACASCGDLTGKVKRPYRIKLKYQDEFGKYYQEEFVGLPTTVIAHEIDHFDGILHIDIAEEVHEYTIEERIKLREEDPYTIIREDGIYQKPKKDN